MTLRLLVSLIIGGLLSLSLSLNWFLLMPIENGSRLAGILLAAMPIWALVVMFMLCDGRRLHHGVASWGAALLLSALVNGVLW
ncbi:hypothetical protein [Gallaecimonas pentaromativorans]|uniref:Uncharacterized protein n=1 Tax=Gallaecimonas pentaromativorans TaxID=584787 RepID=A0A3N1Q0Q1_9GAMM|nr:hypothetical protein [Gallaecimonas pentaromativorans]MED5523211.1 hypothetical protein [Pseudomonadota bacterium]ROQ30406.1 hypothetical protein EDC28_10192 [Gallaecimonas pentaromativorans]